MNNAKVKPGSFGALDINVRTPGVNGGLLLRNYDLTSLDGCPEIVKGFFDISNNTSLTSLVGGPKEVGGTFSADHCDLGSLLGIPSKIGKYLSLEYNAFTSLKGINHLKEMNGAIYLEGCIITSHVLGVFLIKGCTGIFTFESNEFSKAVDIINSHIEKGRAGLLPCQQELIEAGLADFAQI